MIWAFQGLNKSPSPSSLFFALGSKTPISRLGGTKSSFIMFRRRFLSFPLVIGAVIIGVVSGKAIFGPPLDDYWKKRRQEEAAAAVAKENDSSTT